MRIILNLSVAAILVCLLCLCSPSQRDFIRIESDFFSYTISRDGRNMSFIDKATGADYLLQKDSSFAAYVVKNDRTYFPSRVERQGQQLVFHFPTLETWGYVSVGEQSDRVILKVDSVVGEVAQFVFLNIPLTLEAVPDEPFAACALSLNLHTHVEQLPALQSHLWAAGYERFGYSGAEVAIVGVPQDNILPVIQEVVKSAPELPFSDKGGAWALMNKEGYGSYLMDFGTLTLETVDDWIAKCDSLGFNQIAIHGANAFFKNGDFELYKDRWPGGWEDFKKINARLHEAGISSILLTYAYFIDKSSKWVTPVPSPDLGYFREFTLARPLKVGDTEIIVEESTADVSSIVGYFIQNSITLRIGEELVEFTGVTDAPPYKFIGVKRGVLGTRAQAHESGTKAYHLQQMFGQFVAGPDTKLFAHIAQKTAEIINENGFDGLYLDAIDGNNMLGGKENAWYYGSKFVFEIARNLNPMVGMEMCDMPHHYWHYSSRWQAWDRAVRGYKRFVDVHIAALKSDDHRHGEWIGYTESINRLAPVKGGRLMLPLHLGWWGNGIWDSPQVETTFPDDMEYLLAKMIGNDAGLSMLGGMDEKTLNEQPIFRQLRALTRQYERLRHEGYFSESVKEKLRQPGQEFTLEQENGKWQFREARYDKRKIAGERAEWTQDNPYEAQPLRFRLQAQMSVDPFNAKDNRVLAEFERENEFQLRGAAPGVTGSFQVGEDETLGSRFGSFSVQSNGSSLPEGSWIKWEKTFDPCLNLHAHQGLGVWVKGDGSGALLNLRTESPKHLSMGGRGDHFITLDFTGWRYFELVEIESSAFNDYLWPDEYHNVYNSYFYKVVFNCVDKLQVWINKVEPNQKVEVQLGVVKALPLRQQAFENPKVRIHGKEIVFPVRMLPGMYLEFLDWTNCKLYSKEGKLLSSVQPTGDLPELKPGENHIELTLSPTGNLIPRADINVMMKGKLID